MKETTSDKEREESLELNAKKKNERFKVLSIKTRGLLGRNTQEKKEKVAQSKTDNTES